MIKYHIIEEDSLFWVIIYKMFISFSTVGNAKEQLWRTTCLDMDTFTYKHIYFYAKRKEYKRLPYKSLEEAQIAVQELESLSLKDVEVVYEEERITDDKEL